MPCGYSRISKKPSVATADWVDSTAARPNGVCEVNGMFGSVFFADGLLCVGRTSSQRFDGQQARPDGCVRKACYGVYVVAICKVIRPTRSPLHLVKAM